MRHGSRRLRGDRVTVPRPTQHGLGAGGPGSLYGALSDHLANGCIVVGDAIPHWRDVVFEDVRLHLTEDDRELISVVGCHPFDNPFLPVIVGVNRCGARSV